MTTKQIDSKIRAYLIECGYIKDAIGDGVKPFPRIPKHLYDPKRYLSASASNSKTRQLTRRDDISAHHNTHKHANIQDTDKQPNKHTGKARRKS